MGAIAVTKFGTIAIFRRHPIAVSADTMKLPATHFFLVINPRTPLPLPVLSGPQAWQDAQSIYTSLS